MFSCFHVFSVFFETASSSPRKKITKFWVGAKEKRVKLEKCFNNEPLDAKISVDTAGNEPLKI